MRYCQNYLMFVATAALVNVSSAVDANCTSMANDDNPLGQCGCDDQFFMNANCQQGFQCGANSEDGCLYECEGENELMLPHFESGTFECFNNTAGTHRCPGKFNIHCAGDPIPELPLTWSQCDCDGQLWISPDCTEGFSCRNGVPGDGYYRKCEEENEIIDINLRTWNWGCQEDIGQCPPSSGGFSLGCTGGAQVLPTTCYSTAENPLGVCECDDQVFISDDCTQAFECKGGDDYPTENDGCLYTCEEHEIMIPDFYSGRFLCMDNTDADARCTGQWKVHCDNDPVPSPITADECDCNGQLFVTEDCSEGFSCRDTAENGGYSRVCDEGEIISLDLRTYNWGCQPDNGMCPGGSGFSVGCENGPVRVPATSVESETNPIGTCDCADQVFMDVNCAQGFWCSGEDQAGDLYSCGDDELMIPDFAAHIFMCIENENRDFACAGQFQTFCANDVVEPDADLCECDGQMWVSPDCTEGFQCRSQMEGGGFSLTCSNDETIHFGATFTREWECAPGSAQCPEAGGYTVGCRTVVTDGGQTTDGAEVSQVALVSIIASAVLSMLI